MENNPFDIIKVLSDDRLAWVEAAEELSGARLRVWELLADSPGEYIVFNQETKTLVAHFSIHQTPQIPEWWRREDDYAETLPPVAAAPANDSEFEENYEQYAEILQPVA